MKFQLSKKYQSKGDQPAAIDQLVAGLMCGDKHQTLLGVTGSGKTFTMAGVIAKLNRPALVIAHNKTLAAQLASEFRTYFPKNAVEYFVSYYDYYQPEAYLPTSDTYIEKEATINDEIDRLRHAATQALLSRRDVIIVASVSAIYGLGSPKEYESTVLHLSVGQTMDRQEIIKRLVAMQYERTNSDLTRGTFRVQGGVTEILPVGESKNISRVVLVGDKVSSIEVIDSVTRRRSSCEQELWLFPAKHYVVAPDHLEKALASIKTELKARLKYFQEKGLLLEAERLERRTNYDIEMIRELGYCNGIENYSRFFDNRRPGEPPHTLLDYFPKNYLLFIDESHVTVPQLGGMYEGDRARKETLVNYGFRLPSARDNRPLKFDEFSQKVGQAVYVSATPADYEKKKSAQIVEQIVRPTGLVDPAVEIRPIENQIDDLMAEINQQIKKHERTLVTTLTKKMAEDLSRYLTEAGLKVKYLHSEVKTLDRLAVLRDLRRGKIDVVVGVNLLREGLDLPEVSLVAILDADKEGFLRSETSLVQTIGRAARNVGGRVILYADVVTTSMRRAIRETDRRRQVQLAYNKKHNITPTTIKKNISSLLESIKKPPLDMVERKIAAKDLPALIREKEQLMRQAAEALRFEEAAVIRDEIIQLKKKARQTVVK